VSGALVCLTDVTESADLRDALRHRATFDDLTGVHNRASIMAMLTSALDTSVEPGHGVAVVFIDLDHFKSVNDELGHAAGDHVLVRLAQRLRHAVRGHDVVGRIGGDEFLVMCPHVPDPTIALEVASRLARDLAGALDVAGTTIAPRASVGVAWSDRPGTTPEALIRAADAAMYESKRAGNGMPVLADAAT
jgi:diguanylate cyclase (GGDEF)-like protein